MYNLQECSSLFCCHWASRPGYFWLWNENPPTPSPHAFEHFDHCEDNARSCQESVRSWPIELHPIFCQKITRFRSGGLLVPAKGVDEAEGRDREQVGEEAIMGK